MGYKITSSIPNGIVEIERWKKGSHQLLLSRTLVSGYVILEDKLILDSYSEEEGIEVNSEFDVIETSFEDITNSFDYSDNVSEQEKSEIEEVYEDEEDEGLEDLGWTLKDTECWLFGELRIEKLED